MSLITIEGKFKDGQIQLGETPAGLKEARVLVTFLPAPAEPATPQYMTLGQFRGPAERMSTEAEFEAAEWRPTPEELESRPAAWCR